MQVASPLLHGAAEGGEHVGGGAEAATGAANSRLKCRSDIAKASKEFANEGSSFRKGGPFSEGAK